MHRGWFKVASFLALSFLLVLAAAGAHYAFLTTRALENESLHEQNAQLRSSLTKAQERVTVIDRDLERLERLDAKLRAMTTLSDPGRNLAIGPVSPPDVAGAGGVATGAAAGATGAGIPAALGGQRNNEASLEVELSLMDLRLDRFREQSLEQEKSLQVLEEYFEEQRKLLAAIPSIWPTRGWVTSEFGMRSDPYTGGRQMHKGLDVAARLGTPIHAPSDGLVTFAGDAGGYGRMIIIDHGYDVTSRYGHLESIDVRVGQRVKRGQRIGEVGNSGRSTGPHLHYEVLVYGIPKNPRHYILD